MKNSRHCENWQRNAVAVAVASCFIIISPTYANPFGANVVNGAVSISQQGNALNITNSPGAIINWQSFSIGASEATRFIQQSAASSVLNRVTGVDPSGILGILQSNGRVFLINSNGVLFGAGAQVDVAGLVVSTLNLSNADFLAGRYDFTAHAGAGGIENQGNLNALPGGQIYLVASDINNSGAITSVNGDIVLAAGNSVELVNANSPDMRVVIDAPDNAVLNLGSIVAHSGRVGIYAGLINHHGIVSADTATVGATGKVVFLASKNISLEPGSVISASGIAGGVHDGGEVRIIADGTLAMRQDAQVHVDGGVDGGNGGFLELSGLTGLSLRGQYSGRAHQAGFRNGSLLLDPLNINITSAGTHYMSGSSISASASSSVNFDIAPTSLNGGWADVSLAAINDITVSSPISNADINYGTAGGSLTLTAGNTIFISAAIGTAGTRFDHNLTMLADSDSASGGAVNINANIYMGNRTLQVNGAAIFVETTISNMPVTVDVQGAINFGAANTVNIAAGNASNDGDASVLVHGGTITINAGSLDISGGTANANAIEGSSANANANVVLSADTTLDITTTNGVTVQGGAAIAAATSSGSANATANAEISAGGLLTINTADMTIQGGSGISADASDSGSATATANATVQAGAMDITLAGLLTVQGGSNAFANASNNAGEKTATANADALLSTTGALTIHSATGMTVQGGNGASASASDSGVNSATATANATVQAGSLEIELSGPLLVQGGSYASADASWGSVESLTSNTAIAEANALVRASGAANLTVTAGDVTLAGGDFASASGTEGYGAQQVQASANAELSAGGNLNLTVASGSLMVRGGHYASASVSASSNDAQLTATADANAKLAAGNNLILDVSGGITVAGGNSASASASGSGSGNQNNATTHADGLLLAGGLLKMNAASLTIQGGDNVSVSASDSGVNSATATANATVQASSVDITLAGPLLVQGGSAQATGSGGSALLFGNAIANAGAGIAVTGNANITVTAGNMVLSGGSATANGTATADAGAILAVGGIKTLNLTVGSLQINGGTVAGTGGKAAQAVFDPGAITANVGGDIMLTGGNALGAEAVMYSLGPINLTIGGSTGLSLTGKAGAGTGIFPNYNQPLSPIIISFTGGGSVQPFGSAAGADAWIQSLYVVPAVVSPTVVPPTGVPTGDSFQQAFNAVLNGALQTAKGPELNGILLAAGEQPGDEENPLEKKPTYTCQ